MTVWKIYFSTFMRFIANKLGRLLTLGRIFNTQVLKSSPISCLVFILRKVSFIFSCQRYLVQFHFLANITSRDEDKGNFTFSKDFASDVCLDLQGLFFNINSINSLWCKVAELNAWNFIKMRLHHRCFPVKFTKVLRLSFFTEHLQWLFLNFTFRRNKFIFIRWF